MQTASFDLVELLTLAIITIPMALAALTALQQQRSSRKQSIAVFGPVGVSRVTAISKRSVFTEKTRTERLAA